MRKQAERFNMPLPLHFKERVILRVELAFYSDAFNDLSSTRGSGNTVSEIPWTAKREYCLHYGLSFEETEDFFYILSKMDSVFIRHSLNEMKSHGKGS